MAEFSIQPIVTPNELAELVDALSSTSEIYMDTEADSLYHYFEKICLLQFTLPGDRHFLVDPLAGLVLKPLFESLRDKSLVFHGADYDLRMLRADFDLIPSTIFDTMLAARLAGHLTVGLDALVERYVGKHLDHRSQKADWSQRPLSPRLLNYAVEDTCYLPVVTQKLREELSIYGRTEWHRQQCQQLLKLSETSRIKDPKESWRIKGSFHLDRQSLAILRELWKWRDKEARRWDRPPYQVCSNEKLLELTAWAREHPHQQLLQGPKLPKRWPSHCLHALSEAFKRAWALPESEWPLLPPRGKRPPYNPEFGSRLNRLRATRDAIAKKLCLGSSILAPNAMLEAIAVCNPKTLEDFQTIEKWLPWQTEVMGQLFLKELNVEC